VEWESRQSRTTIPDHFTFSNLISLLSERDHLDSAAVRLVYRVLFLDSTAFVTNMETSESAPNNIVAKPAPRLLHLHPLHNLTFRSGQILINSRRLSRLLRRSSKWLDRSKTHRPLRQRSCNPECELKEFRPCEALGPKEFLNFYIALQSMKQSKLIHAPRPGQTQILEFFWTSSQIRT
jgi:hypothetical protein